MAIRKSNNDHTKHKGHQRCCGNINNTLWRQPKCIKCCCNKKHECTEQPPRKASISKSCQHKQRPRTGKRHCYARDTEQITRSETMIQDELPRSLLIRLRRTETGVETKSKPSAGCCIERPFACPRNALHCIKTEEFAIREKQEREDNTADSHDSTGLAIGSVWRHASSIPGV